jgi:hypothetical protein
VDGAGELAARAGRGAARHIARDNENSRGEIKKRFKDIIN